LGGPLNRRKSNREEEEGNALKTTELSWTSKLSKGKQTLFLLKKIRGGSPKGKRKTNKLEKRMVRSQTCQNMD